MTPKRCFKTTILDKFLGLADLCHVSLNNKGPEPQQLSDTLTPQNKGKHTVSEGHAEHAAQCDNRVPDTHLLQI